MLSLISINFYHHKSKYPLKYSVIIAEYNHKLIYCKHRKRTTYELPGGHIEPGETALQAAKRELFEETGAIAFDITPICIYSVDNQTFGGLFYASITNLGPIPASSEMEKIDLFDTPPQNQTYQAIQLALLQKYYESIK